MSIESTRYISRKQAEDLIRTALLNSITWIGQATDSELEESLYTLTRESHPFDNFKIVEIE